MPFLTPALFMTKAQTLATALRLDGVNQRLQRTVGTISANRLKATHSIWFRVPVLGVFNPLFTVDNGVGGAYIAINADDEIVVYEGNGVAPPYRFGETGAIVQQDEWHHLHVKIDTAATDVLQIKLDGVLAYSGNTNMTGSTFGLQTLTHSIGYDQNAGAFFRGDLAIMHWVDGVAMESSDFADVIDGIYQAKEVHPTYGVNGMFLPFADPDDIGKDFDNGNDFTLSNITAADLIGDGPPVNY